MSISVYHRYSVLALVLIIFFLIMGFAFGMLLIGSQAQVAPPVFFAKMIDQGSAQLTAQRIEDAQEFFPELPIPEMILVATDGSFIYPHSNRKFKGWERVDKPTRSYDYRILDSEKLSFLENLMVNVPFPLPGFRKSQVLVRLSGEEATYLLVSPPRLNKMKRPTHITAIPIVGVASLVIALFFGVGLTTMVVYARVRKATQQADKVIWDLQNGLLESRFEIKRNDEFGRAMQRFNLMADEIEKLVNHLKQRDASRRQFFQELAHDLRTPIASVKTLMETLSDKESHLDLQLKSELVELSLSEIQYFERLVEDLLLLAKVSDTQSAAEAKVFDLTALLDETSEDLLTVFRQQNSKLRIKNLEKAGVINFHGDAHLIERLLRNAFQNAFSFASETVQFDITADNTVVTIRIEDDGPGFSETSLAAFGERQTSRGFHTSSLATSRISIGLGSVIMRRICEAYGGSIEARNIEGPEGKVIGAALRITLPNG